MRLVTDAYRLSLLRDSRPGNTAQSPRGVAHGAPLQRARKTTRRGCSSRGCRAGAKRRRLSVGAVLDPHSGHTAASEDEVPKDESAQLTLSYLEQVQSIPDAAG